MIRFEDYTINAASLGTDNPMPDIKNVSYIHAGFETTANISADEKARLGQGMINTLLPYKTEDGYDRVRSPRVFRAAVLENDSLRALFLPELGGRLWSLYDKRLKRELLYKNSVFQPANLGLRNARFSGGVEFNVGIKGRNPLTVSPMFCEVAAVDDCVGEILNMYEYERIRGIVYTVGAWLPENSNVLYINSRVENTSDNEKYMYWWSNIAVPETPETRVIVPAKRAFVSFYGADHYMLDKTAIPFARGTDLSYPKNLPDSQDFFYEIDSDKPKWIATADADGKGLLQCSTDRLFGRKMFLWGQSAGGRNWNGFLSEKGQAYIEIQAGLARTQLEHIPMPARCRWDWTEAYTALDCPPEKLNSPDWDEAVAAVSGYLKCRVGDPKTLDFPREIKSRRLISRGSGWGALENRIRAVPVSDREFPLDKNDPETGIWHRLLDENALPEPDVSAEPVSYVTGEFWRRKLEGSDKKNWYTYLQLGVVCYALGVTGENAPIKIENSGIANGYTVMAEKYWRKSLELKESAWALRNLAMLYKNEYGNIGAAKELILRAVKLLPDCRALETECAAILTGCGEDSAWIEIFDALTPELKSNGRLKFYRAVALMHLDRLDEAAAIINGSFEMCDIKEGEISISAIWFELYGKIVERRIGKRDDRLRDELYPLPHTLDFRMH